MGDDETLCERCEYQTDCNRNHVWMCESNDEQRQNIKAFLDKHGGEALGVRINLYGKMPVSKIHIGTTVYNFDFDAIIPCDSKQREEIVELILEYNNDEIDVEWSKRAYSRVNRVYELIREADGLILYWQ